MLLIKRAVVVILVIVVDFAFADDAWMMNVRDSGTDRRGNTKPRTVDHKTDDEVIMAIIVGEKMLRIESGGQLCGTAIV